VGAPFLSGGWSGTDRPVAGVQVFLGQEEGRGGRGGTDEDGKGGLPLFQEGIKGGEGELRKGTENALAWMLSVEGTRSFLARFLGEGGEIDGER